MLCMLVVLIALAWLARLRYPGKAPGVRIQDCDAELWNHVYRPERLHVVEPCTAVAGRVVSVHRETDGDLHIALTPDDKSVLNLVNAIHAHRTLVVEVVCEHAPSESQATAACAGFTAHVTVPNAGDRIRVIGAYVTDRDNGWNEVHPVTRVETLH